MKIKKFDISKSIWNFLSQPGLMKRGSLRAQYEGERELIEFLSEEIANEQKAQKSKPIPKELDGFQIKFEGSEVELLKQAGDETIEISFNVNHTVDTDEDQEAEINPSADKPEFGDLKSKPNFEVDVKRGSRTLSFTCSFMPSTSDEQSEGGYRDVFGIDEVTIYEGKWSDKGYLVAGDVLDGYLYDLLMNYLDEKGVSNEFVDKLCDLSTAYEHKLYVDFLGNLQKFSAGK
ncbi:complement component 1 Q subcomponent-binding protein, mitochondrial isoform X3 [Bacillus rossius redtenbacheri]|uniref:complement component 1 Q subcomponent-binding protein, mitochondrial isoform X3 n=1 Tax=Bacillus rossius redtenbacheri TaxID=93214 RepID=UPI002FDEF07D